ncbi:PE-PPE domain-containing protein [Williamsia sp. CHRR-6]|uniref:PE-PPE domain-containing protein n=1 Tax=Williamsia sp. CHRR-6 TaxID=2835871 RepID=UPI001BDAF177|nr:PE-PPE domain-containing protein [Williamsia sp. CHRR-6]MBT0566504.1 PE-PPE domain-containing protein [Williamsia sp. CHRR-6]
MSTARAAGTSTALRVLSIAVAVSVATVVTEGPVSGPEVRLTAADSATGPAATVYVMGGNTNPTGTAMDRLLGGYFSTAPGTPYAGYRYTPLTWPADIPFTSGNIGGWTPFDAATRIGSLTLIDALSTTAAGTTILVVGYSSSAAVVTKTVRALAAGAAAGQPVRSPEDLSFLVLGNPNRPNGGVMARLPGIYLPLVGITFDGATPPSPYPTTDVALQYDGIADFPVDVTNLLAVTNAILGMGFLHPDYRRYDITDPRTLITDVRIGTTRFLTVRADRLPLLMPFYLFGFPTAVLDALDPILRAAIEVGYDRTAGPGTATTARIGSPLSSAKIAAMFAEASARSAAVWAAATAPRSVTGPASTATPTTAPAAATQVAPPAAPAPPTAQSGSGSTDPTGPEPTGPALDPSTTPAPAGTVPTAPTSEPTTSVPAAAAIEPGSSAPTATEVSSPPGSD